MTQINSAVSEPIFLQATTLHYVDHFAATLFAASWGPVAVASVYSKKVTENGAFWSIPMRREIAETRNTIWEMRSSGISPSF